MDSYSTWDLRPLTSLVQFPYEQVACICLVDVMGLGQGGRGRFINCFLIASPSQIISWHLSSFLEGRKWYNSSCMDAIFFVLFKFHFVGPARLKGKITFMWSWGGEISYSMGTIFPGSCCSWGGGASLDGSSKARILRSALTLKESVVQRVVPMEGRCSPYQRNRLGARRRKLEESDSRVAGLWGHQSSSSGKMWEEATSVSPGSELAWAGSDTDRF